MFRLLSLFVLLGTLGISGFYRRRARQSETIARSRESGAFIAGRLLVALPLFLGTVLHIALPGLMSWATFDAPGWSRLWGALLGILALPGAYWVFTSIGKNVSETVLTKSQHELVMVGPYRWIRHPLYLTGIALFLSIGLMNASWFVLAFTAIVIASLLVFVIPAEERALTAKFGDRYISYMRQTGRLLPKVGG